MKGKINKIVTFLVVIGLIISTALIKNILPFQISKNVQTIDAQDKLSAEPIGTDGDWRGHIYSYSSRIGRHLGGSNWEEKTLFYDKNLENGTGYKNLYCIKSGGSHAYAYNIYDLYNLDEERITKYFKGPEGYKRFLWILEHMYLVDETGEDRVNMEEQIFKYFPEGEQRDAMRSYYENMVSELDNRYKRAGLETDGENVTYTTIYNRPIAEGGKPLKNVTYTTNGRDNFIKMVQNYFLLGYAVQRKTGNYGTDILDANGHLRNPLMELNISTWKYELFTAYNEHGTDSIKFIEGLLNYLKNNYPNDYDIEKYRNFENNAKPYTKITYNENTKFDTDQKIVGPFTLYNKYGFEINITDCSYGNDQVSYEIVDKDGNVISLSDKRDGEEFYIRVTDDIIINTNSAMNVSWNILFEGIPVAHLFEPEEGTNQPQVLVNIERKNDNKEGSWTQKIGTADIALKKYITKVNNEDVPLRLTDINLTKLINGDIQDHNAEYTMNKTPVTVRIGDKVTYAIRLFNEGNVAGTATEITDYLPNYLSFNKAYYVDSQQNRVDLTTKKTGQNVTIFNPQENMTAFSETMSVDDFKANSQVIYVECTVNRPTNQDIYTNIAEISKYRFDEESDMDSVANNWDIGTFNRSDSRWISYSNEQDDKINGNWNVFYGQEDDDDFDKIKIEYMDVALTKRIEGYIDDNNEEVLLIPEDSSLSSKQVINKSGYNEIINGSISTLNYEMNKKVATISRGQKIVTVISVYNEGPIDALIKKITDYVPRGLSFNKDESERLNDNKVSFSYNNYRRELDISLKESDTVNGITLNNINNYTNDCDKYEVKVVFDVDRDASGRLYNSAAITDYGYIGADNKYYAAQNQGVDRDSYYASSSMAGGITLVNYHNTAYKNCENVALRDMSKIDKNSLHYQDDDDVDVVEVLETNSEFDLALRKYIYKVQKDFNSAENQPMILQHNEKVPYLNGYSVNAWELNHTAEYYQDKLKVLVEKGDLVTYRIRVYNEGTGDDYRGRATQITDYLPQGLIFKNIEEEYTNDWEVDTVNTNSSKVVLNYKGNKILPVDSINELAKKNVDNPEQYYQEIGIVCEVTADASENIDYEMKPLTNRAAITKHEAYELFNGVDEIVENVDDIDSSPDELSTPNLDTWYEDTVKDEQTPEPYYPGEQDDDDFDTIYVNCYKLKIQKKDGTNLLPGIDLEVYKYRHISNPVQDTEAVEIQNIKDAIKTTGEGEYISNAPTLPTIIRSINNIPESLVYFGLENDVYIIKEISTIDGHYNPFKGKYIRLAFSASTDGVNQNFWRTSQTGYTVAGFEIFEDNGDNDYTNDTRIEYSHDLYKYVKVNNSGNNFTIIIDNTEIKQLGKYEVRLIKKGINKDEKTEIIEGVQFDASGKFNGGSSVAIPHAGAKLESSDDFVSAIPDSYTDGYITINADTYETPDEIILNETGIREGATDSEGHLIDNEYYIGLAGKELKITINKDVKISEDTELYYVKSVEASIDGKTARVGEGETGNKITLDNGSIIELNLIKNGGVSDAIGNMISPAESLIGIVITNPYIEKGGDYNLNLLKYKKGSTTPVAGVHFTASAHVNGEDETIADRNNPLTTGTTASKIKEKLEILEDKINNPDTYTFTELDVGSNDDIYVGLDQPIKLTVNKTIDKSDIANWVFKVDSVTMKIGDETVTANSTGKKITLANGTEATIKYDATTKTIELSVTDPKVSQEGNYNIYLKKTGIDGKQLGGVQFEAKGYFNGNTTGEDIPAEGNKLESKANDWVEVIPDSLKTIGSGTIDIDPDNYETPDYITLKETGLAANAVDQDGNAVDAKYYLGFKNKEIKVTFNKDVNTTDPAKEVYYVKSIKLEIDGTEAHKENDQKYTYTDSATGSTITVELKDNNRIEIVVTNPTKTHEGDYSINLKKMGTNGRQLGGVVFETTGHFNGADVSIPNDTSSEITSLPSGTVNLMPDSFNGKVTIDENHYTEADKVTFKEVRINTNAVDDQGNNVSGNYYLPIQNKEFELTINKTKDAQETKDIYKVSSLGLKVDGSTNNITGSGFSYTYDDPNSEATVTVTYNETSRTISIVVSNPPIDKEGTYHVKLIKYKQGSNTPVAGVKFTADAKIDDVQETIADNNNPLTTEATPVTVKDNAAMSEEKIQVVDRYVLKETNVGSNSDIYIGYTGNITLNVEKDMDTSDPAKKVFYVKKIWLTLDDQNNSRIQAISDYKSVVTLENGTKIEIEYNTTSKTIEIRVTDPVKEGNFKLNLIKRKYNVDENGDGKNDPLQGAVFNVKINDGTRDIKTVSNQTTNQNGEIPEISGIDITAENLTYTITVEEVSAPEGYIGLGAPVSFTAKSKFDGTKYVLDTASQPTIQNEYIQAEVSEDEILIEAENRVEPVIHKGVKTVENQNSGYDKNEIQTWVINTTVPKGIKDYTVYNVTDTIDKDKTNVAEKRIAFINEDNPGQNVVVKIKDTGAVLTEGTHYKVNFYKDEYTINSNPQKIIPAKTLEIIFINATNDENNFVGGRNLTEDTTLEITFKTQFTLDSNGDPIGLNQSIPNEATLEYNGNGSGENKTKKSEKPEVHTGGLGVYKYDKETDKALVGAKFRLVRTKAEAEAAVEALWAEDQAAINAIDWVKKYNADGTEGEAWEVTTGSDGYAYFKGLEFGEDASDDTENNATHNGKGGSLTYEYNWEDVSTMYYLVETYVPEDYVLLEDVAAECEVKKDSFVVTDLTTCHKVGNELVVPEGEYALEIAKYGKYENEDPHPISGVVFSAKRKINGLAEEDLGNLTETDSTGRTVIGDKVTIDKDKVNTADEYTIHEVSIPETSEYYVGLEKDIKLTVSKQSVKSEDKKKWLNSVTGINMSIEGTTVTEVVAGKKYTAIVTKDGQELEVTAELLEDEEGGQYIKLTVEDPHKVGDFKLNIIKTVKGTNPEKPLPGTGFKVSIKNGNEALVDGNGKVLDGTNEFFVNDKGELVFEDLNIKKPGLTYDVEIEESTVPTGYIGISDKIKFSAVSKVKGAKLGLEDKAETKISNDVVIKYEEDEIWVDVENKPEPVIHKGVKSIRNQDAGYDGDEIQTWVINSTIEAGIEDYTQYIITDEIDFEKPNVEEKRIEYIPGSIKVCVLDGYEGNKVKDLVENTDYTVNFDDEKKIITITFISVDENDSGFKAGRNLPAGKIIDIKYNTKFRLDENGLIIGLQQTIKNEATLTFGVRNHEDKEKKSETPEVHTGAVGVIKYEDVNKNKKFDDEDLVLEGAHFKIVRTKEEADKALAAVLAGDEETLKTISFVKVRDEDGNETDVDVELITNDHGKAIYEGLGFGASASDDEGNRKPNGKGGFDIYGYDWETAKTEYYLVETEAPYDYYLMDHYDVFEVSKNSFVMLDESTYYKEADKPKIYDLSLRKFITHVNGVDYEGNEIDRNITDRIPRVTLTDEFKDKENDEVTTAIYEHTKEPVIVQQGNTVTYTIRVYNEGPEDAYASIVKDDIPDGVEFIKYTEGDGSVNDTYRWKMVDENDKEVSDISKAKYIVTDYLSMEQGEVKDGVNSNLLKGYDSKTMKELDYRDLKVQFNVTEPNTSERILTNYAQITEMTNSDGKIENDRDSTPNEWIEGEDDQDVEHIRLLYFDLALRKWVTKAIVISDGEEKIFETGHKAEDDPEDVVKVDLKKSKLDKVVVKFEYQIRITNEGRIGGWCDEITDHIPEGLTFDQADNPVWTVVNDKTITTDALKDTYLEPGESAEVTVVLRWENSGDNLGIKVNVAEISKDRNEYGVHDIDSTPGNYKWGEDDIDDAPVMLAVTTGNMVIGYTILGLVVVSIITVGAIAIKKVRSEVDYF